MRVAAVIGLVLYFLVAFVTAWEKEGRSTPPIFIQMLTAEDHQLFQLQDELERSEGPNATFYSFIGVGPGASHEEITKAYRKKASRIHPDKAKQSFVANYGKPKKGEKGTKVHKKPSQREINAFYKEANDRFARLGVVANILRGSQKERYDFFLRSGFPTWRGTGWYYRRYRPGAGTVILGLFIVMGGLAHYGALYLSWKRQREFMKRYIRHARRMAWGDESGISGIPGLDSNFVATTGAAVNTEAPEEHGSAASNRKQRRMQEKQEKRAAKDPKAAKTAKEKGISTPVETEMISGPRGTKKRVVAENGRILIVDSVGNVFLEETTEEGETHEYLLDPNEIAQPTFYDTAMIKLPVWVYKKIRSSIFTKGIPLEVDGSEPQTTEDAAIKNATAINPNDEKERRKPATVRRR